MSARVTPLGIWGQAGVLQVADHQLDLGVVAVLGLTRAELVEAAGEDREVAVVVEQRLLG
jgi:hypothetical protein